MADTNQLPASWLGFRLINQAAADDMGASVLPSANSLSGRVWLNLTDADGDPIYVAGIVVAVSFTASAVRYSVAFPIAPQPREGETMYAVVENIGSSWVVSELPEGETLFDAVLTEDAAKLMPRVELLEPPVPVLDSANTLLGGQLEGELTERKESLESAIRIDSDPLYILGVARDVISLAQQVRAGERAPVVELDPTEWPGYAAVLKDEALAIKWQDRLDSFFQKRVIDVRNALRELGWTGGQREALSKNGIIARFDFWQVGAGKNVVGMTINGIQDDLRKDVLELAAAVDATAALPEPEPTPQEKPSMDTLIKIAADTLAQLRRIDVYRVLNSAGDQRAELASYIATGRADLVREVTDVMAEEWPDLGWAMPSGDPAVVERQDGGGELLVPGKDGAPKELEVPPIPPEAKSEQERNPARAADMVFLNSVISANVDMWADDLADKIEALGTAYEGDEEVLALWGQAIQAYTDYMVKAMG